MDIATLQLSQHLKKHGYSLTRPRKVVFRALENKEAISMGVLVKACNDQLDRATVYRTVALFESLGIVQRLSHGFKYKLELSGDFSNHHHHLSCVSCGELIPFSEDQQLETRLNELAQLHRFSATTHQIEIQGLCRNCFQDS